MTLTYSRKYPLKKVHKLAKWHSVIANLPDKTGNERQNPNIINSFLFADNSCRTNDWTSVHLLANFTVFDFGNSDQLFAIFGVIGVGINLTKWKNKTW
jgi:hypothetical protein